MTINVPLLDRIEQQITQHPETWGQEAWFALPDGMTVQEVVAGPERGGLDEAPFDPPCGTAYCVGGWAAVLTGHQPSTWGLDLDESAGDRFWRPDVGHRPASAIAQEALGLTAEEASRLFSGHNTLDDLRRIFAELRELAAEQAQGGEPR